MTDAQIAALMGWAEAHPADNDPGSLASRVRAVALAAAAEERKRWRDVCEKIARDLRNHDMLRLGAAKCIDAAMAAQAGATTPTAQEGGAK